MNIDIERETKRVYYQNMEAANAGLPATLTLDEWLVILEQFQGLCAYCECKPFEMLDHILPKKVGGGTTADNCVPACRSCNSRKSAFLTSTLDEDISLAERLDQIRYMLHNKQTSRIHWGTKRPIIPRKRVFVEHTEADMQAIAAIRERYGLGSDSEAIRFALHTIWYEVRQPPSRPRKERRSHPPPEDEGLPAPDI